MLLIGSLSFAAMPTSVYNQKFPNPYNWTGNPQDDMLNWAKGVESVMGLGYGVGTGNIYYVDSAATGSGTGLSLADAKTTLDAAFNLCTASNGDVIIVAQGTTGTFNASTTCSPDVIGVTVLGCGNGTNRPTFTFATASLAASNQLDISANGIVFNNIRFVGNVSMLAAPIKISAAGVKLLNCEFTDTAASSTVRWITLTEAADNAVVAGCVYISPIGENVAYAAATPMSFVSVSPTKASLLNGISIIGNQMSGAFGTAGISFVNGSITNTLIYGNFIEASGSDSFSIKGIESATGFVKDNSFVTSRADYGFVSGTSCKMALIGNSCSSNSSPTAFLNASIKW